MSTRQASGTIRVVVLDDHPIALTGTRAELERHEDIEVVGVAGDGATGLLLIGRVLPDVLLLDIHLPDMTGVEVARQVIRTYPEVGIVALTGYDEARHARTVVQLGVRGYLRKTASSDELAAAVRAVSAGRTYLTGPARPVTGDDAITITDREGDVLQLLAAGRRNAEIAESLTVSMNTVEFHVRNLLAKLGARSRTEAVAIARREGLIDEARD